MFELTDVAIEISHLRMGSRAGAFVSFEGRVRVWNEGREVKELEYEAYPELALHYRSGNYQGGTPALRNH